MSLLRISFIPMHVSFARACTQYTTATAAAAAAASMLHRLHGSQMGLHVLSQYHDKKMDGAAAASAPLQQGLAAMGGGDWGMYELGDCCD
jgi:hypothetical protein